MNPILRPASLLLAALLLPALASAQATDFGDIGLVATTSVDGLINLEECEADQSLTLTWQLKEAPSTDQTVTVYTDTVSGCSSTTPLVTLFDAAAPTGTQTVTVRARTDLHGGECTLEEDHDRFVCFSLDGGGLTEPVVVALAVAFDTVVPQDPTPSAVGGDMLVELGWSWESDPEADVDGYRAAWQIAGETDPDLVERSASLSEGASSYTIEGLTNDTEYEVWVETRDDFGNWSEGSASALAIPRSSDDFWEHYRGTGGAQAGCAQAGSGGAGLAGLLLLLPGLFLLGRRRTFVGLLGLSLAAGALLAVPATAQADGWVEAERGWHFELEVGPYFPEIDDETAGTPYADVFGTKQTLLGRFRLERAIWQGVGQVGIGLGAGFGQDVGKGLYPDGTASPDTTVFNWVPFDLTTYRFDYAAFEWGIPLVPFARAGIVWDLWWILDSSGGVAVDGAGERAQGGRWGFEYELGLQLLLDVLDPQLAKDFERSSGVDNSYLYFAYRRLQIDGFGSVGFDLSVTTWSAGLAIEF